MNQYNHGPCILTYTLWDALSSLKLFQSLFSCTKIVKTRISKFYFNLKIDLSWINVSVQVGIIPQCKLPQFFPIHIHRHTFMYMLNHCYHSISCWFPPRNFFWHDFIQFISQTEKLKQLFKQLIYPLLSKFFKRDWYTLRIILDSAKSIKQKSNKALRSSE